MKPAWDSLAQQFANSDKVVIADVDCTAEGKDLCERFGVEGFPTIKFFNPPDEEGESYEGGRDLEELREFAKTLGPGCSPTTKENCSPEQLAELETTLAMPEAEREAELAKLKAELAEKEKAHEKAVSDSIQGLFAGGLSAAGAMPRKPSIVAKKEPPGSPKKEGAAPTSSKRSGSVALPPAAERRGSVGMLDDDAAEKTKKRMGSFGGKGGGMTFGVPSMGPAQVRATHFSYSGESPYFSRCFFSRPDAASPARTP